MNPLTDKGISQIYQANRRELFDYLTRPFKEGSHALIPVIRVLVEKCGGKWSSGEGLYTYNKKTKNIEELKQGLPDYAKALVDLGRKHPLSKLVRQIQAELHKLLQRMHSEIMKRAEEKADDKDADPKKIITCEMFNSLREFTRQTLLKNLRLVQTASIPTPDFVKLLMRSSKTGNVFDRLNGSIRSNKHVVSVDEDGIHVSPLSNGHEFARDAGHDLGLIYAHWSGSFMKTLEALSTIAEDEDHPDHEEIGKLWDDVETVFAMFTNRFKDKQYEELLALLGMRLIVRADKLCVVFEGRADLGKTTLMQLILRSMGDYAVPDMAKDAISGQNKRKQPVREVELARDGVRFIGYDEVSDLSQNYLKHEANGAAAVVNEVGMGDIVTAEHKAMRLITKNETPSPIKAMAHDVKKKVVLINESIIEPPLNDDDDLYQRIKTKDPDLLRAVFIVILMVTNKHVLDNGLGPMRMSDAMLASAPNEASVPKAQETNGFMLSLKTMVRQTLLALYETSNGEWTPIRTVKSDIAIAMNLPLVDKLKSEDFLKELLDIIGEHSDDPDGLKYRARQRIPGTSNRQAVLNVKRVIPEPPPPPPSSKKRAREDADSDSS